MPYDDVLELEPEGVQDAIRRVAARAGSWNASTGVLLAAGHIIVEAEAEEERLRAQVGRLEGELSDTKRRLLGYYVD
jgi:hypothetical protein